MRVLPILVALVLLPLAGCFANDDAPAEDVAPAGTPNVTVGERPAPSFNNIPNADLGSVALPDLNATLMEAPNLIAGEWWRIRLTSPLTGDEQEFVRVVARVEDGLYVIGMPHEGWWKEAVVFHTPAFGDINKDLSHRAHDVPFMPLKFPLTDGATWETYWESEQRALTATVKVIDEKRANVVFTGSNCGAIQQITGCDPNARGATVIELTYDATQHEVVAFKEQTVIWEVVEHGYDYQGWITVPRGEHLVFFHGRIGSPFADVSLQPATGPFESVLVNGGYNRVSFILAAGNIVGTGAGGAFIERATAPDGTQYELQSVPGGPLTIEFYENDAPDGQWDLEHIVAGGGYAFIEGIAYHQYDIHLPTGNVRTDHSHEVVR